MRPPVVPHAASMNPSVAPSVHTVTSEAISLDALPSTRVVHEAVHLPSGRAVIVRGDERVEQVVVRAPDGTLELTVKLTAEGPVLQLAAVALELAAERLCVDVDHLDVKARKEVRVESMGSVESRVLGNERSYVQGESRTEAGAVALLAHRGALCVEAAEDVRIEGATVRLNC